MTLQCDWQLPGNGICHHLGLGQMWLVSLSHLDLLVLCIQLVVIGFLGCPVPTPTLSHCSLVKLMHKISNHITQSPKSLKPPKKLHII